LPNPSPVKVLETIRRSNTWTMSNTLPNPVGQKLRQNLEVKHLVEHVDTLRNPGGQKLTKTSCDVFLLLETRPVIQWRNLHIAVGAEPLLSTWWCHIEVIVQGLGQDSICRIFLLFHPQALEKVHGKLS